MKEAVALTNAPLQINHANVEAVRLLSQGRAPEADLALAAGSQERPSQHLHPEQYGRGQGNGRRESKKR